MPRKEKPRECLIFFESYRKEGQEKLPVSIASAKVFALVAETQINDFQEYFDRFSRKQIHVVKNGQDPSGLQNLPNNLTFEIFELEFAYQDAIEQPDGITPWVDIDDVNKEVMKSLLSRMPYTSSRTDSIRDTDPDQLFHPGALTRFFTVIEENIGFIEKWLDHGAELVYRRRNGETLLHFAVRMDSESLVNTLLRFNFDVDASRYDGLSPLHIAAKRGHLGIILSLIRHGASINPPVTNYRGLTPLILAAKKGHLDVVKTLINVSYQAGSVNDINAVRAPDGWSCLHVAAFNEFPAVVEILVQHGADMGARIDWPSEGATPLVLAVQRKCTEVAEVLLRAGSDVNTMYNTDEGKRSVLFEAVNNENLRMIELILAHHPDPSNHFNKLAFYHALATQTSICKKAVEIMCRNGFTVDDESLQTLGESRILMVLFGAVVKNCPSAVNAVLKNRDIVNVSAKPDYLQFRCTSCHLAAAFGDDELLKLLIDHNADVNSRDEDGKTPLFYAVARGNVNSLKFLITQRVEVDNQPELVYAAIYLGNSLIMETLLVNGAKVNEPFDGDIIQLPIMSSRRATSNRNPSDSNNVTISLQNHFARKPPIFYAVSRRSTEIVKLMLKYGAFKTSGSGHSQRSSLIIAAGYGRVENSRVLLDYEFPKTLANYGLNNNIFTSDATHREYANTIAEYFVKIKSCGLPVPINNLSELWMLPMTMEEFQAKCEIEITKFKNDKVGNTDVSYYDILMQDVSTNSGYAKNDAVREMMVTASRTGELRKQFPIYGSIIEAQVEKGHHRRFLLTRAIKICCILSEQFKALPDNLKERIIDYLDNRDLQYLGCSSRAFFREE